MALSSERRPDRHRLVTHRQLRCTGLACHAVAMITVAARQPARGFRAAQRHPLDLSYGIEEEFFLVDPASRDLVTAPPSGFLRECRLVLAERVGEEMLRAQVELTTPILHSSAQAVESLAGLRQELGQVAQRHGLALVASGTHPLANWEAHQHTDKPRYDRLVDDYQIVGRRNLVNGLHVHVGIPEGVDRVALMNRLVPWLPVFLSLSTSSPFWNGRRTGLYSYRQAAYDEHPRSGIPDAFEDEAAYAAFVELLARCGAIGDGSFLWWNIRPSTRYPTLELRIADACTRLDDALALAAAFRCLVRAHLRQEGLGVRRTSMSRRVADENRWRAKRYGTAASFIDEEAQAAVGFTEVLERMLALIGPDAQALECEREVAHLRTILRDGTSAHQQLAIYHAERDRFMPRQRALQAVVDWLHETTLAMPQASGAPTPGEGSQELVGAVNA